ncbi:Aspartokinase [Limihaloglobus sulfuriphilus]|uniref:Aspartokinase n=1 Tax=Limihaloglobus sulfuriphilus TaxID=1851148 RepID=A0A1Q2MF50_9BACT|nr:aspartate kinase [Limihaloglobus sulfuriphilus]AQQ71300.1 Aspartokinase [Limihaloglobus sulfuriphilus]
MAIIVQKFGGTSVADAEKIQRAARRAKKRADQGYQVVMVTSARGKMTDHLIADALELNPDPCRREMDQLLSTGEQQTVALMAMALHSMGQPAISMTGFQAGIRTDAVPAKARITNIEREKIQAQLDDGKIVVVAGFQGIDEYENITTLGRGGSDTSAVALAAALEAEQCEIYTDVDGVYTTDPRKFKRALKIDQISYDEMLEMASLGAGVMHGRAIEFGKKYGVTIHVRSSSKEIEGTLITHEVPKMEGILVSGATIQKDLAKITIIEIENHPGIAARIFANLAKARVSVNDIIQTEISEDIANLSFTVGKSDLADAMKCIKKIKSDVNYKDMFVREDIAEVSIVGIGMRTHYGVADKMFNALAQKQVNIDSITTSEIRISCIIDKDQGDMALETLCTVFELDKEPEDREM